MRISSGKQLRRAVIFTYLCFFSPIVFKASYLYVAWNSRRFLFHPLVCSSSSTAPHPCLLIPCTRLIPWSSWYPCALTFPCHWTQLVLSSSTATSYSSMIQRLVLSQLSLTPANLDKCNLGMPANVLSLWCLLFQDKVIDCEFLRVPRTWEVPGPVQNVCESNAE